MPKDQSEETVSLAEHNKLKNKLEVAKNFLKQLDLQVSKYESLDIDALVEDLEKYETLGSVEDLVKLKSESEKMRTKNTPTLAGLLLKKVEQDETPTQEEIKDEILDETLTEGELADKIDNEAGEDLAKSETSEEEKEESEEEEEEKDSDKESYDDSEDDDEDEEEEEEADAPVEVKFENAQKRLARYKNLGSPRDIKACFNKMESLMISHRKVSGKLESYQEIGSIPEIVQVCTDYAEIKTKQESVRISEKLGIPVEKVASTIEKMESVAEAEKLLGELFSKSESEKEEVKQPELKEKVESAVLVGQKPKSESDNLANLRQTIKKL